MSYYDGDYYQEPTEFEYLLGEFKTKLAGALKEEHKSEVERLRTENREMASKLQNLTRLEAQAEHAKHRAEMQVGMAKEEARQEFRKARAMEILAELTVPRWLLHHKWEKGPKCGDCDQYRKVKYTTPLGREASEPCPCDKTTYTWEVEEAAVKEASKRNGTMLFWYIATRAHEDSGHYDAGEHFDSKVLKPAEGATDQEICKRPNNYGFTDPERCQRIANMLNKDQS